MRCLKSWDMKSGRQTVKNSIEEDIKHLEKRIDLNRQMYLEFGRL